MTPTNSNDTQHLSALGCVLITAMGCLFLSVPIILSGWLFDSELVMKLGVAMLLWPVVTMLLVRLLGLFLKALVWLSGE